MQVIYLGVVQEALLREKGAKLGMGKKKLKGMFLSRRLLGTTGPPAGDLSEAVQNKPWDFHPRGEEAGLFTHPLLSLSEDSPGGIIPCHSGLPCTRANHADVARECPHTERHSACSKTVHVCRMASTRGDGQGTGSIRYTYDPK